ncbi:MAG: GNAT family N-acetyltransferase, partial [Planctomycetota bacterium]
MTDAPDPTSPRELREGLESVGRTLEEFLDGLETRAVAPQAPGKELAESFAGTLGAAGVGLDGLVKDVQARILPHAMGMPHPLYLGLLNCSPLNGGILGDVVVSALNNNAGAWEQSPPFAAAEAEVLRLFRDAFGLPEETNGLVLPGGSYACLHALQLAREAKLPDWRERGVDPRATVYVSASAHFSAVRAATTMGILPSRVIKVPTRGRGALDPDALRDRIRQDREEGLRPTVVVATAGTTGTGAIDPVEAIADICEAENLWLHVDACYGGAAVLLEELQGSFKGVERADSVAIDPHKWLFVPMVAGVILCRHPGLDLETFDVDAPYIPDAEHVDGYRAGLPTSRRASGFTIWATLRAHGLQTAIDLVRQNNRHARLVEERLAATGFEVLEGGELSIACVRWPFQADADALQAKLADAIVASGVAWFGTFPHAGKLWLRMAFVNARTTDGHVERLVEALRRNAGRLSTASRRRLAEDVRIIELTPRAADSSAGPGDAGPLRKAFKQLNLTWLEELFVVEDHDAELLSAPDDIIIKPGGHVFGAELDGEIVGVGALLRHRDEFELTKMAVRKDTQGMGIGERLVRHAIA